MVDDAHLLRQFVEARSETAFAELVQRHLPLVFNAATRQLGANRHLAEDITQSIFLLLARKSGSLLEHPSLAGWLHTATCFKCARELRTQRRRQWRENTVAAMNEIERESIHEDWERIRPVLDQVLQELNARDREAVLLRFFENCSFVEIAARLRFTEAAAHKCVERALDKLRVRLSRRGLTSTATLAALLGSQGALAAPAGLGVSVMGTVIASGLPFGAAAGLTLMATKTTAFITAAGLMVGIGIATLELRSQRETSEASNSVEREVSALRAKLAAEQERIARERAAQLAAAKPAEAVPRPAAATTTAAPQPISAEEAGRKGREFLKAHPEVEAILAANLKILVRHNYSDLIAAMRLTEPEIERFVSVAMNLQMHQVDDKLLRLTDELPQPAEYARQLKEVLGEERYQYFRDYGAGAASRGLTNELTRALYYTSSAPTPEQLSQFKAIVQQVVDDRSLGPRASGWSRIPEQAWDEVVTRTSGMLSPPQREALAELRQLATFMQAQSQAARARSTKK